MSTNPKPDPEYNTEHIPSMEEFDNAKHNFPSIGPVAIAMGLVAIVVIGAALLLRQPPAASGSIGDAFAVDVPNQNLILCTMQITVENRSKKTITIHGVSATLHTDQGDLDDTAAPAGDFERYLNALPDLKPHTLDALRVDTKIPMGGSVTGSVIVAFPVSKSKFDSRKGITATVQIQDHADLKLNK